jgi:hypothetical protein
MIAEPVAGNFEYTVRLNVAIPLAWAKVLKATGAHHYDHACREMSECGVVNGLYNIATFNENSEFKATGGSWPSTHPVAWRDCDGMMKIMEQAHQFDHVVVGQIRAWLRRTMDQIEARHREVAATPAAESAVARIVSSPYPGGNEPDGQTLLVEAAAAAEERRRARVEGVGARDAVDSSGVGAPVPDQPSWRLSTVSTKSLLHAFRESFESGTRSLCGMATLVDTVDFDPALFQDRCKSCERFARRGAAEAP